MSQTKGIVESYLPYFRNCGLHNVRPRHSIYEAPDGESLHLNPIFPVLAVILSRKAPQHCETIEELLQIPAPPAEENLQLLWKEEMLSRPVFPRFRRGLGLVQGMETANKMADRLRSLGIRAGFPEPLTTHDFRAEHVLSRPEV